MEILLTNSNTKARAALRKAAKRLAVDVLAVQYRIERGLGITLTPLAQLKYFHESEASGLFHAARKVQLAAGYTAHVELVKTIPAPPAGSNEEEKE